MRFELKRTPLGIRLHCFYTQNEIMQIVLLLYSYLRDAAGWCPSWWSPVTGPFSANQPCWSLAGSRPLLARLPSLVQSTVMHLSARAGKHCGREGTTSSWSIQIHLKIELDRDKPNFRTYKNESSNRLHCFETVNDFVRVCPASVSVWEMLQHIFLHPDEC